MVVPTEISTNSSTQKRTTILFVLLVIANGMVAYLQADDLNSKKWFQFFAEIDKDSLLFLGLTFTTSTIAILFKAGISLISIVYIGSVLGLALVHKSVLLQLIVAEFCLTIAGVIRLLVWMVFPESNLVASDLPLFSLADILTDESTRYSTQYLLAQVNLFEICYWIVLVKLFADAFSISVSKSLLILVLSIGILSLVKILAVYSILAGLPS